MFKNKKFFSITIAVIALLAIFPLATWGASKIRSDVYVEQGLLIDDNFFKMGDTINIEGSVNGDVVLIGNTVNIKGQILGDVLVLGETVNIGGDVAGNVRVAGNTVKITGRVARNANILGGKITIDEEASIGKDLLIFGGDAEIKGKVQRNISGRMIRVDFYGDIGGNINLETYQSLNLKSSSIVRGSLYYSSFQRTKFEEGAWIKEKIVYKASLPIFQNFTKPSFLIGKLIYFLDLLVSGLIIILLFNKKVLAVTKQMLQKPFSSVFWGIVCSVIFPCVLSLLALSVVGVPLALMGLAAFLVVFYVSQIFVGIAIGQRLLRIKWFERMILGKDKASAKEKWQGVAILIKLMFAGLLIYLPLTCFPIAGPLFYVLGIWWMFGGLIGAARNKVKAANG